MMMKKKARKKMARRRRRVRKTRKTRTMMIKMTENRVMKTTMAKKTERNLRMKMEMVRTDSLTKMVMRTRMVRKILVTRRRRLGIQRYKSYTREVHNSVLTSEFRMRMTMMTMTKKNNTTLKAMK
jgi:hypothetical protein